MTIRTPAIAGAVVAVLAGTSGYCAYNAVPPAPPAPVTLWPAPAPETPGLVEAFPIGPVTNRPADAAD